MKMVKELEDAFNLQMAKEFASFHAYLNMAPWYINHSLNGFANWMNVQAEEEFEHAKKIRDYLFLRGNNVCYTAIGEGNKPFEASNAVDGIKAAQGHEESVTQSIHALLDMSKKHNDHGAVLFLQWFVTEQEEEDNVQKILDQLTIIDKSHSGLFTLDKMLAERVDID